MIVAAIAALEGVPLILVTGGDVVQAEIKRSLPDTRFVIVKSTKSTSSAESRPRAEVSSEIESEAERALRDFDSIPPWSALATGRITNEYGYRQHGQTQLASLFPGAVVLNDKAIALDTDDVVAGYLAYRALANYTHLAQMKWIVDTIYELDDGQEIMKRVGERYPTAESTFTPTGKPLEAGLLSTHGHR